MSNAKFHIWIGIKHSYRNPSTMNGAPRKFVLLLLYLYLTKRLLNVQYIAISIYVVESKLQVNATRRKGGMGRLELILDFRGCRCEIFPV